MIKINLLPPEVGKRQAGAGKSMKLPKAGVLPYVLAVVIGIGLSGFVAYGAYDAQMKSKEAVKRKLDEKAKKSASIKQKQEDFERKNQLTQEIEQKFAVVQALGPENRIFWSEKLNMIARSRLNLAVYVTKLKLEESVTQRETLASINRRTEWEKKPKKPGVNDPAPKPVMQPIINQALTVEAIAYGQDSAERLNQVNNFYTALRTLEWERESGKIAKFLDEKIKPEFIGLNQKIRKVGGVTVLGFGFRIEAQPQEDRAADVSGQKPGSIMRNPNVGTTQTAVAKGGAAK